MYTAYFGLREPPFALTPDPGYLFLSSGHREALAHLLYGVSEDGGFVQLTGEIGTGKTTLIRTLLAQRPANVDVALCLNPQLSVHEFVATLCDELGIATPGDTGLKSMIDALNRHLLDTHARGRHTVVIIDEAQNLSPEVLEQVRLLTNLETHRHKLLRMVLVGQPELQRLLARPELRQLAQRITARYHLHALDRQEAHGYLEHRLSVAGGRSELLPRGARRTIQRYALGIPRLLNIIADRALLGAYADNRPQVSPAVARRAAREVLYGHAPVRRWRPLALAGSLGLTLLLAVGVQQERSTLPEEHRVAVIEPPVPLVEASPVLDPPVVEPDLTEQLATLNNRQALRQLLALWGISPLLAEVADTCATLQDSGLRCLHTRTDWSELRRYNRPALLTLIDPASGNIREVLLQALHGRQATLVLGHRMLSVELAELTSLWTGDALLLWQPPTRAEVLRPGSRGDDVAWLRRQLAEADNQPVGEPVSELFDAELAERVREFQRRHGLRIDGLVGPATLLVLTGLAPAPDTPRLIPVATDQV